jgi:2-keto-4-pentenoate hydratase/2-oxohepta-3-ene-1,7-dioic acid hydratase in catechol pathway
MKLARFEIRGRASYGLVQGDGVLDLGARFGSRFADLEAAIAGGALREWEHLPAQEPDYALRELRLLKPVSHPEKILCVGVNYVDRNAEYKDGSDQPKFPSLFVRFPDSLVAHEEPILRPPESRQLDYEGELAVVIGRGGRRIPPDQALSHIAGYTICNEGSVRDWLRHGKFNVTQGKNFERSGSLGPWMVTPEELGPGPFRIITRVNGDVRQDDTTNHMIFPVPLLIAYISTICTLKPADVIVTGTPSGAGARLDPPRYLVPGDVVEVEIPGIGTLRNAVADERS